MNLQIRGNTEMKFPTPQSVAGGGKGALVPRDKFNNRQYVAVLMFFAVHIPLAIAMGYFKQLSTLHALVTVGVGLCWLSLGNSLERAAYVAAYITGAEVLWRMTGASVFWEFGKYACAIVLIVAMVGTGRLRVSILPILYFGLLLPAGLMTFDRLDFNEARMQFSFNMSGPFALMVSVLFFSQLRLSIVQMRRILMTMIGPIVGIAALISVNLYSISAIRFSARSSNFAVTGGFGPNQVSAALSLGAVIAFLYVLYVSSNWPIKTVLFVLAVVFASQSALTFSRAGLYMAGGSIALSSLYLARDTRSRIKVILVLALVLVIANYVILPRLDAFTNHAITGRFENTYESGREKIMLTELMLWRENPFFGVGPGVSMFISKGSSRSVVAPHTEFSRLLVEHGLLGLLSLCLMLAIAFASVKRQTGPKNKAFALACLVWGFLFMSVNAMRIVAPSFLIGLASMALIGEQYSPRVASSVARLGVSYFRDNPRLTFANRSAARR